MEKQRSEEAEEWRSKEAKNHKSKKAGKSRKTKNIKAKKLGTRKQKSREPEINKNMPKKAKTNPEKIALLSELQTNRATLRAAL